MDKYKIDQKYRNFTIIRDGIETEDSKTLLVSPDYVVNVIVNKEKRYINIITKIHDKVLHEITRWEKEKSERLKLLNRQN